jgi:hypothetical protein
MAWNKGRLAYTPLGPYVAKLYEEGMSYGKIAKEVGIYKGCVQNLCRVIGIPARENHTTNTSDVWEQHLADYIRGSGVTVVERPLRLTKKSRVVTRCKHGSSERPCGILKDLQHCCRIGSKVGGNNPAYGLPSWNSGTVGISTGHGFGGNPSEEERKVPGTLYFIRYLDESGIHFKIGITKRSLQERLGDKLVSILHLHQATLGECFDLEQSLLKWAKDNGHRYSSPTTTELIRPEAYNEILSQLRGKIN